jgi:hypothetical protein
MPRIAIFEGYDSPFNDFRAAPRAGATFDRNTQPAPARSKRKSGTKSPAQKKAAVRMKKCATVCKKKATKKGARKTAYQSCMKVCLRTPKSKKRK